MLALIAVTFVPGSPAHCPEPGHTSQMSYLCTLLIALGILRALKGKILAICGIKGTIEKRQTVLRLLTGGECPGPHSHTEEENLGDLVLVPGHILP